MKINISDQVSIEKAIAEAEEGARERTITYSDIRNMAHRANRYLENSPKKYHKDVTVINRVRVFQPYRDKLTHTMAFLKKGSGKNWFLTAIFRTRCETGTHESSRVIIYKTQALYDYELKQVWHAQTI